MNLCINPVLAAIEKNKHHQCIIFINKENKRKRLAQIQFSFCHSKGKLSEVAFLSDKINKRN